MALKALVGRCDLDILIVAQLNRGAYGLPSGPDVSHLAGTSELERYASAVWLIERPKAGDGPHLPNGCWRYTTASSATASQAIWIWAAPRVDEKLADHPLGPWPGSRRIWFLRGSRSNLSDASHHSRAQGGHF
jgi:hypothetical protein